MKNSLDVSVIVPVYNVEKYIGKCIESIIKQTFHNFEVIIIDDESPDNSIDIVKKMTKKDDRFKIISQKNRGLGGARNTGIDNAKGEYLFFLDSDDYIEEDTLEMLVNYMKSKDVDIVVFDYCKVKEDGEVISSPKFGEGVLSRDDAYRKILSLKTSPQAWNKLYKKKLFIENNIYYPEKFLHEDIPVTHKLFWKSENIGYIGKSFYYWVERGDSITQKITYKHINDVTKTLLAKKEFLHTHNIFDKFEMEYIRGSVQMLNLLLERSWNYAGVLQSYDIYRYTYMIISSELVLLKNQIEKLKIYDKVLYDKLNKNMKNYKLLDEEVNASPERLTREILVFKSEIEELKNSRAYKMVQRYYKIRDSILPLGSKRRTIVKSIIGRR